MFPFISFLSGFTLLKKNKPLADTIDLFKTSYATNILVNTYINSADFWPNLLFNPNKMTSLLADPQNTPAAGFSISFTPGYLNKNRVFDVAIQSSTTKGLLDTTKLDDLQQAANQDLTSHFTDIPTDSVNASMFNAIATLRNLFTTQSSQCNISQVTFQPCTKQLFGFDVLPDAAIKTQYEELTINGRTYEVPWKSVATGATDSVRAQLVLLDQNTPTDTVLFRSPNATLKVKPSTDNSYLISFTGGPNKTEEYVEAYYTDTLSTGKTKEHIVGKLKIRYYTPIAKKLTPIILNGTSYSLNTTALQDALNKLYQQAAVQWTVTESVPVTVDKSVWDCDDQDGILKIETSPSKRYSNEMQAIIDAVQKVVAPDPQNYYLVITNLSNNLGYTGYMPLEAQCAFLFTGGSSSSTTDYPTIAHELGHGAFYMKHIEDAYKITGATDNLMNGYTTGKALWKPQWDWMGDPISGLYDLQKESDGAMEKGSYWNPAGYPVQLPTSAAIIYVDAINAGKRLNGIVYGWQEDENTSYKAVISDGLFKGYLKVGTSEKYQKYTYQKGKQINVLSVMYNDDNCTSEYYSNPYTIPNNLPSVADYENGVGLITDFKYTTGTFIVQNNVVGACYGLAAGSYGRKFYDSYVMKMPDKAAKDELVKLAVVIDNLGSDLYEGYVVGKEWDNSIQSTTGYFDACYKTNQVTDYSAQSIQNITTILTNYKYVIETLKTKSTDNSFTKEEFLTLVNQNFVLGKDIKQFFNAPFLILDETQRINLISLLSNGTMAGRLNVGESWKEEDAVLEILHSTPKTQHKLLLDDLYTKKLLFNLVKGVDGDNFDKLITTIASWVIEEYPIPKSLDIKQAVEQEKCVQFNNNFIGRLNTEKVEKTGDVYLSVTKWSGKLEYEVTSPPYEYLPIKFVKKYEIGASTFEAGLDYKLPALYIYMLFNTDTKEKWKTLSKTTLDVSLAVIGVAEIQAAVEAASWGQAALGIADMGVGFTDVVVSDVLAEQVKAKSPEFYENWQKISLVYGLSRLAFVGLDPLVKNTYSECQILKKESSLTQKSQDALSAIGAKLESEFGDVLFSGALDVTDVEKLTKTFVSQNLKIEGITFSEKDPFVDVIIHSTDGKYVISINNVTYSITESSLAQIISQNIPSNKTIRLLSCSDLTSAKKLSNNLSQREIIASDKSVKIFSDGTVDGAEWYSIKGNVQSATTNLTAPTSKTDLSSFIRLGEDLAKAGGKATKLNSYTNLKTWVNTLDDVVDGSLISKLDGLDATYLTKLEADIASASNGAELKALIKESPDDLTDIYKVLKDDPKYSFELAKTGGSRWEKWAQGNFFKTVTQAGKDFEQFVSNNLLVLRSKLLSKYPNIDLNNYAIFEQVQIKTGQIANGADEFFVADFVLVKKKTVLGQEILYFDNAIVLETKLSSTTALTTPQANALAKIKTTSNTFEIRSITKTSTTDNAYSLGSSTSYKTVKVTDYIKVNSDGIGNTIQDVTSLK